MHSFRPDALGTSTTRAALVLLALLVATPAAAFQLYTDRSAWEDAVSYDMLGDSLDTTVPGSGSSATEALSALTLFRAAVSVSRYAASRPDWEVPASVIGLAADWHEAGASNPLMAYANLAAPTTAPSSGFIGIVGDTTFIQASLHNNTALSDSGLGIENLTVATASAAGTAAIPEPSGLLVFSLGFAVLAARTRHTSADTLPRS